uniref:Uncharacterized protein n=1 Tax=Aegilops tauschii TaxID=37682 RepID=M8B941_AEGTA
MARTYQLSMTLPLCYNPVHLNSSPQDEVKLSLRLLHGAPEVILEVAGSQDEVTRKIVEICLPCIGRPKSVQDLNEFLMSNPIVCSARTGYIPDTTAQGRLLSRTIIAVILECHSEHKSWNGALDSDHIRIIKPRESKEMFMMILKDGVEFEGEALLRAKVNDLRKAALIFRRLYQASGHSPVYVLELIQALEGATTHSVAQPAFMEFLRYHPAIMASAGRTNFTKAINRDRERILVGLPKPTICPNDWRALVKLEGHMPITVVYRYGPYGSTVGELIRFMRNVLEHGKEHQGEDGNVDYYNEHELELYLANTFHPFLPSIMRTLLALGKMEEP